MTAFTRCASPREAVDRLEHEYKRSVAALRAALERYAKDRTSPAAERVTGAFVYPELRIIHRGAPLDFQHPPRAFARLHVPGTYAVTITRPDLFRAYLLEQLEPLVADYGVAIEVGRSSREIAYPYVLSDSEIDLKGASPAEIARYFPTTHLAHIGDELADGLLEREPGEPAPLALFDAPRTDFSLARLRHYTGTPPEHFQKYILLTNYHRYVDEIVRYAAEQAESGRAL